MILRPFRLLASFLCGIALVVTTSSAAAPLSDISGEYRGVLKNKIKVIDTSGDTVAGSETLPVGVLIGQEGVSIGVNFVIFLTEVGEQSDFYMYLTGSAGNGNVHMSGSNEDGSIFLTGTMKGAPGKRAIKLKGAFVDQEHIAEFKVSLKEGDSGIEL